MVAGTTRRVVVSKFAGIHVRNCVRINDVRGRGKFPGIRVEYWRFFEREREREIKAVGHLPAIRLAENIVDQLIKICWIIQARTFFLAADKNGILWIPYRLKDCRTNVA